ncbi:MAG: response regulator [Gemmatimonadaceae bacterium]
MTRPRSVLVIEDNEDNRIIVRAVLSSRGFRVSEATDGAMGIAKAIDEMPDVILMDVSIPIIDGLAATRILKQDPATAMIPIIALTAHALATDRAKALDAGCDDYISKPTDPRTVLAAVQRWTEPVDRPFATES